MQAWEETAALMKNAPAPDLIARALDDIIDASATPVVVRSGTFFQASLSPLGVRFMPRSWLLDSIRSYYKLTRLDGKN